MSNDVPTTNTDWLGNRNGTRILFLLCLSYVVERRDGVMIKVKELNVWFLDDSETTTHGECANDATVDLLRYAMKGLPKFVELHKGSFYAMSQIASFNVTEEEVK